MAAHALTIATACLGVASTAVAGTVLSTTLLPTALTRLLGTQDLRAKYNAKWAVVTGGCSGIGKAIVRKLASQGINVIIVDLRDEANVDLGELAPKVETVYVRANLLDAHAMDTISERTQHLDVSLVFCNAGACIAEEYHTGNTAGQENYLQLMTTSQLRVAKHFYVQMVTKGLKGAIVFTSSMGGNIALPFCALYSSSKAFIAMFAAGLSMEAKSKNIDVLAVRPGSTNTNIMVHKKDNGGMVAQGPDVVADCIFSTVGRFGIVVRDVGFDAHALALVSKLFGTSFLGFVLNVAGKMSYTRGREFVLGMGFSDSTDFVPKAKL
eukprot:TRINITY_DN16930_c0_g1_i1.p1 TRINITY_DN16930_c0_g1~~TRINITY_DN16930_c0_g1_i1.p1  ORF type:complete len:333 (-),score=72.96 TRINITY_DN16930_c0_g1_i1:743-1714(-)